MEHEDQAYRDQEVTGRRENVDGHRESLRSCEVSVTNASVETNLERGQLGERCHLETRGQRSDVSPRANEIEMLTTGW